MTMVIDTLKLSEDLKKAGFPEQQARALADKFGALANDHLVTKEYLDFKLKELRYSLILSLGTLITAIIGFFKIMEHFAR
jgi:hypothetical protein